MFLVCVFNVRLKISIRIRTGAVCSFHSLRIFTLMLSGPQVLCVLMLCRSLFTPGRDIESVGFGAVGNVVLWFHSEYRLTLFIDDVGFLLCVSCDLSIAPHWCDIYFVCTQGFYICQQLFGFKLIADVLVRVI